MFPRFMKDIDAKEVFFVNGYDQAPVYRKKEAGSADLAIIVSAIREENVNTCGYIDGKTINYHTCESDSYFIDMDKDLVYAYFKDEDYNNTLPLMLILEFLKYKAGKFMLVYENIFFLFEKTKETNDICRILDEIYFSESFFHNVIIKAVSSDDYEMIFYKLVEIFSLRYMNKDSSKLRNMDILIKVLKMNIS